jgi:hypothetical protein|nr:MAG TPA: hypothetical protein [Caudoviricetes sp.]
MEFFKYVFTRFPSRAPFNPLGNVGYISSSVIAPEKGLAEHISFTSISNSFASLSAKSNRILVARSVLLVGRVEGEPNIRALVQIKNNLAQFGHPKAFELMERGFKWMGDYEITADEVLGGIAPKANKLEQAKRMLRELAETSNAVQSNEIFDMAEEQGISKRTLENAKKELGIRARKINNSWYWELDKIKQI